MFNDSQIVFAPPRVEYQGWLAVVVVAGAHRSVCSVVNRDDVISGRDRTLATGAGVGVLRHPVHSVYSRAGNEPSRSFTITEQEGPGIPLVENAY